VVPPSWRPDIEQEEDLVEELGRVHGYDKIPEALPKGSTVQGGVFGLERQIDRLRQKLVAAGFQQTISHSLGSRHALEKPGVDPVSPRVVASPEHAFLRSSLFSSLSESVVRNEGKEFHFFEIGRTFSKTAGNFDEKRQVAMLSVGGLYPGARQNETAPHADFFSLKAVVEACLPVKVTAAGEDPRLHPTRQAALTVGNAKVGVIGQIHPDVAEAAGLSPMTILAEADLEQAFADFAEQVDCRPMSKNPSVRRDIAFLIDKATSFAVIEDTLRQALGDQLERMWLFDVYEGKGIPEGKHSLAVALQLRKFGANFTDEEANQEREKAVQALVALGATQR
jgi:phenylalanyl-tRNA synthetase beta chain